MNASRSRRSWASSSRFITVTSSAPNHTLPESGRSSPPTMFSSVVLPEPDRPCNAVSSPGHSSKLAPRSARTEAAPLP